MDTRVKPACDGFSTLRLLRLEFLDRSAGVAPGGEPAAHMRDRFQPHVLRGFRRQRRTHAAGAMKDELLVALENRLGIGASRVDPEFQHAAGAGKRAGNPSLALDLPGVADIDDHDVVALRGLDGLGRAQRLDLRIGLVDQRLDAAVDGLGHFCCTSKISKTTPCKVAFRDGPEDQTSDAQLRIGESRSNFTTSRFRISPLRGLSGMTALYRTSSFIAPSRPSIVIGNMRCENSRRMSVVDSE